jgi:replication-associated recombination protein RarA
VEGRGDMRIQTTRGYKLLEVASALQKAIRRGDARMAGYWAIELYESGYTDYVWRRLYTISAEDCWGVITHEVDALHRGWKLIQARRKDRGRVFVAKATLLLAQARKSRDADHLTNLVYDPEAVDERALERDLAEARQHPEALPDYAFDVHTGAGKRAGKTRREFFITEHDALSPREKGLFDADVEAVRQGKRKPKERR